MNNNELTIMTFNLRINVERDGINSFFNRTERILDVIQSHEPDIIGFQEVNSDMKNWLRDNLTSYYILGCGRDEDYLGESMIIAYKPRECELISMENVWLSPTPSVPGSNYGGDQSSCSRMFNSMCFKHNKMAEPFYFINTHFDHIGNNARIKEATQICTYICDLTKKYILVGDFNAEPQSDEIRSVLNAIQTNGGYDASSKIDGTFHEFGNLEKKIKIDYVFTNLKCIECSAIEDIPKNGVYYSDHNAIFAKII